MSDNSPPSGTSEKEYSPNDTMERYVDGKLEVEQVEPHHHSTVPRNLSVATDNGRQYSTGGPRRQSQWDAMKIAKEGGVEVRIFGVDISSFEPNIESSDMSREHLLFRRVLKLATPPQTSKTDSEMIIRSMKRSSCSRKNCGTTLSRIASSPLSSTSRTLLTSPGCLLASLPWEACYLVSINRSSLVPISTCLRACTSTPHRSLLWRLAYHWERLAVHFFLAP